MDEKPSVTYLLKRHSDGDPTALDHLIALLYPELKMMARRRVRQDQDIGATTLVQETFLKLLSSEGVQPEDRGQFFGLAATIMRRVMIDDARYASAKKRQGTEVEFIPQIGPDKQQVNAEFLLRVDNALNRLAKTDRRLVKVFECRYFGGYSMSETAEILGVSVRSAERLWTSARKHLAVELSG